MLDLIHHERNTPNPFEASKDEIRSNKTLEDHVKLWLVDYIKDLSSARVTPTDDQLLIEAQRIVRKVDTEDTSPTGPDVSWFRDLIMLCKPSYNTAQRLTNQRSQKSADNLSWITQIEKMKTFKFSNSSFSIIGCEKEKILMNYVKCKQVLGQTPTDSEMQAQACKAIEDVEPKSNFKNGEAVQWFKFLINSSTIWLSEFKRRAGIPSNPEKMSGQELLANSGIITYNPFEAQENAVHEILLQQPAEKILEQHMQHEQQINIHNTSDSSSQAESNEPGYLNGSQGRNSLENYTLLPAREVKEQMLPYQNSDAGANMTISPQVLHWGFSDEVIDGILPMNTNNNLPTSSVQISQQTNSENQPPRYFLSDVNCYGRLEKELTRFVASCLSPNNPLQHVRF